MSLIDLGGLALSFIQGRKASEQQQQMMDDANKAREQARAEQRASDLRVEQQAEFTRQQAQDVGELQNSIANADATEDELEVVPLSKVSMTSKGLKNAKLFGGK